MKTPTGIVTLLPLLTMLTLPGACSGEVEGGERGTGPAAAVEDLQGHATMARSDFVRAIELRLDEFERAFRAFEARAVLAGDEAKVEVKSALSALPPMRDALMAEFQRFKEAAETATTEQRKELVDLYRRLERALSEAVAKERGR